jgi:vancomycin aglycone glucosyltransferase
LVSTSEIKNSKTNDRKKVLMSTIGSRGDVQPLVALGLELLEHGHQSLLCVGPNFKHFVESQGLNFAPYGPDLTSHEYKNPPKRSKAEEVEAFYRYMQDAFESIVDNAQDCDLILVGGAFHHVGRTIAESLKIPYICAAYCPTMFPSSNHPPPRFVPGFNSQTRPQSINKSLWKSYEESQNELYLQIINSQRDSLGLAPINNVHPYVIGEHPWLAADKALGSAVQSKDLQITQTGAFLPKDQTPLPDNVLDFLEHGRPPIYVGFGSMDAGGLGGKDIIEACRAVGHRAIIYRGWANLDIPEDDKDIIAISDINHSKLFPRVAAVIHHGGAGTTTAAAIAGVPQILVPHFYDQYYWAHRVKQLGVGFACRDVRTLSVDSLAGAMRDILHPDRIRNAKALSNSIELNGAENAAKLIDTLIN